MSRALELALRGAGSVSPNPMVGAVITVGDKIIGEGWHKRYGQPHAEVNAIDSVENQELLKQATMYVTLEPCSHWGKTPPCCDLIINKQIPRVVVGCIDPYHEVCGGGIERMRAAGINVEIGDMEAECQEINKRFFTSQTHGRPYVILKWAQTSDGYIDIQRPTTTPPAWLTGEQCKQLVHTWRAVEDAVMVGRKTVEMDNPSLTVRLTPGRNPLRITIDRNIVLGTHYNIFDNQASTLLITSHENRERATAKFLNNPMVEIDTIDYLQPTIPQILSILTQRRIQSLIVEGGTQLLQSFIDDGLWDQARIFTANIHSGELYESNPQPLGIAAPKIETQTTLTEIIDGVELDIKYRKTTV